MIVSLDAFLASEEYAKESIKDLKNHQGLKPGLKGGCAASGISVWSMQSKKRLSYFAK